jgi:FecR protein
MPFLMVNIAYAEIPIEIVSAEGSVTVSDTANKTGNPVQTKSIVPSGKILSTGPTARAVVRVGSDGIIVLGKNSQVEIGKSKERVGFFRQITGVVYYALNSIKGKQRPVEVRTATSTIGIRGTRFIVTDVEDRDEIGMRKGEISVVSPEGEFEVHKQVQLDEFEAMKREAEQAMAKEQRAFEEYSANTQKEFIEYKREFSLGADRMVSFNGKRVEDRPLSGETKSDMESFEGYAEEWLKSVRD